MATRVETPRIEHGMSDRLARHARLRTALAVAMAICGGLAALYVFFAFTGTVSLSRAIGATLVAVGLAAVWLIGFIQRLKTGAGMVTRRDRERRGF